MSEIAEQSRIRSESAAHSGIAGNELAYSSAAGKVTCGRSKTYEDNGKACRGLAWMLHMNKPQQSIKGP